MYNLLISLAVGDRRRHSREARRPAAVGPASFPASLAFAATYILLPAAWPSGSRPSWHPPRRSLHPDHQSEGGPAEVERAVKMLEQGLVYDKWQFMVGPEIHAQIGMLKYMVKDWTARPGPLRQGQPPRLHGQGHGGRPPLPAQELHGMERSFEAAVKTGKKEVMVWAAYAWCLLQNKEKDKASRCSARAVETNPTDEKLKASLTQLQNDKRLKMKP